MDPNSQLPKGVQNQNNHGSTADHGISADELKKARDDLGDQLLQAEDLAALKAGKMPTSAAMRERDPGGKFDLGDSKSLYQKSKEARKKGGRRGVFIGLGAGGGIVSVLAGVGFLMPFKMHGIMSTLIGDAGKRLENVVERRAERVFMQFVLRGSRAAGLNGNLIVTGNPIGDLFANMRTANFELELKEKFGLEFQPGPNKTVKLVHNGTDLGDARNPDDILKILDKGGSLSRSDLKKIIKATQTWPFYKRAKFVKWLRLKYNIPRFGVRDIEPGENEDDYNKEVMTEHIQTSAAAGLENAADFVECVANSGDCPEADKSGSMRDFIERSKKAISETSKELVQKGVDKINQLLIKAAIPKIIASSAAIAIPLVGEVDTAVRLWHGFGNIVENDVLQKKHAEYIAKSSAVLGAGLAGISDQGIAGELPASTVGMFADRFNGWEESASYSLINDGKVRGEVLDGMERVNESITLPEFANFMKNMIGTVGWPGFRLADAWFYTVSKVFDLAGEITGSVTSWIVDHTPARALLDALAPFIADIFEALFKVIGMTIDPLAVGAKLAMYIHQGFLSAFNGMSKELGMRLLSIIQGRTADAHIRQERLAELSHQSFYDRIFNLENPDSLATKIASTAPSTANPALALVAGSARLVASAPSNLSRLGTGSVYAEGEPIASEELFGINMYGGTEADLSAELHPNTENPTPVPCPENRDDAFNHCKVDPTVVDAMKCGFVKCADMTPGAFGEFQNIFATDDSTDDPFNPLTRMFSNLLSPVILDTKRGQPA